MSSTDYIKDLSIEQLEYLIEISQAKLKGIRAKPKQKCFVVSDGWLNHGHYRISDPEAALSMFNRKFLEQLSKGNFEKLSIEIEKYYPDEMKEIFGD